MKTVTLDSNDVAKLFILADMTCADQIESWETRAPEKQEWRALRKALKRLKADTFARKQHKSSI